MFPAFRKGRIEVQKHLLQPGHNLPLVYLVPLGLIPPWKAWSSPEDSKLASWWPLHLQDPEEDIDKPILVNTLINEAANMCESSCIE